MSIYIECTIRWSGSEGEYIRPLPAVPREGDLLTVYPIASLARHGLVISVEWELKRSTNVIITLVDLNEDDLRHARESKRRTAESLTAAWIDPG